MTDDRAQRLLEFVGGRGNVVRLWHCMSRLRFALVDDSRADDSALSALSDVVTVVRRPSGEYHVAVRRDLLVLHDQLQVLLDGSAAATAHRQNPVRGFAAPDGAIE